ncbi:hypothetical protein HPB47_000300 [Ixodes persulcatus]|uniref:Uncharacterized protein n=1 Tax=Ixodes persulcatus TaxID=34615 RepID=A0AC60PS47_IXOPE|nr:hypothetical protein HPB47_000300 [Ixodes persulcatus]
MNRLEEVLSGAVADCPDQDCAADVHRLCPDTIMWTLPGAEMYNEGLYFTRRNPSYEQIPKYPLCTVSQTESCQLSSHLTTWNKFLVFLGVRLREVALACNKSLEQVTFDIQPNMIMDAYRLVRETGTMGRVTFRTDAEKPELFGDALKGCTNSVDITFHLHWTFATGLLHKAFQQFTFCRHLVQLDMSLYKEIDGESAQSFASFLSSTNTLRGLRLGADASVRILGTLLEGLSRNRSISVLLLTRFSFHKSQLHSWERMFQDNTVLRDLTLYLNQQKASLPVVSKFPRFLANNYTLLSASFWDGSWFEPHMYQVQDIVRRNVTMLHRAADFAVGRYTKRCAEAFERMRCHESLVGKVQELDRGTERDAVAKIGVAARYLDVNFMAVAGVVREAVVCDGKAGLQLDGIGLDNWLKVRSYLKVSDIRDRTAWADFQEWLQAR